MRLEKPRSYAGAQTFVRAEFIVPGTSDAISLPRRFLRGGGIVRQPAGVWRKFVPTLVISAIRSGGAASIRRRKSSGFEHRVVEHEHERDIAAASVRIDILDVAPGADFQR
ncbi:MAG TPA: hypothetical protein VH138_11555 [Vicinamibacterales bacterium]|jgi:hypothetical protein|nr:hypothetical protein [Vicinamibacterales bacterium]